MALPIQTPSGPRAITNPSFEDGTATGWALDPNIAVVSDTGAYNGLYCLQFTGSGRIDRFAWSEDVVPVVPGQRTNVSVMYQQGAASSGHNAGAIRVRWLRADGTAIEDIEGTSVGSGSGGAWHASTINAIAPAAATHMSIGIRVTRTANQPSWADAFSWNYSFNAVVDLTAPASQYTELDTIPCRVTVTNPTNAAIRDIRYYRMTYIDDDYQDAELMATVTEAPYSFNAPAMEAGNYAIYAVMTFTDSGLEVISNSNTFTVGEVAPPDTREYKASNAYTYLVGENILNLGSSLPATSVVTGIAVEIDYSLEVLVRARDRDVTNIEEFTPSVVFDIVQNGVFETSLMSSSGGTYTILGSPATGTVPIQQSDFTVTEEGIADGTHRWTVYGGAGGTFTLGGESALFGLNTVPAAEMLTHGIGVRFYPTVGTKPDYALGGDACVRVRINAYKIRVYFDAGSVEYYFASPDKGTVIKGTLVSSNVDEGNLTTADASGTMQLLPTLEYMDDEESLPLTIMEGWTIHSYYPVTDDNQIGDVDARPLADGVGMSYNGLPSYHAVMNNRSRYMMNTYNFYGDPNLDSIYGANGVGRAFAYNGTFFYTIQTTPEADKDKPRHVAFHHSHLALGYGEGRVDISVVGSPWNFSGFDGASSWAIGDPVVGLSPLNGTMLGIFGAKSITGISGTTVDNFATQTISPNIGAIEYTVTDMGFPVYANAYGIYTLSQTSQYGDYIGSPMSQAISPWLRPRLIRKLTSNKEIVVAWPVRSKNQYRLAFSDGYVLSMTMNYGSQTSPTFSKQKYFLAPPEEEEVNEWVSVTDLFTEDDVRWYTERGAVVNGQIQTIREVLDTAPAGCSCSFNADGTITTTLAYTGFSLVDTVIQLTADIVADKNIRTTYSYAPDADVGVEILSADRLTPPYTYYYIGGVYPVTVGETQVFAGNEGDITLTPGDVLTLFQENNTTTTQRVEIHMPPQEDGITMEEYTKHAIVPAAISSELDESGEERIHVADKQGEYVPPSPSPTPPTPPTCATLILFDSYIYPPDIENAPPWMWEQSGLIIDWNDNGDRAVYVLMEGNYFSHSDGFLPVPGTTGRGTIYSSNMSQSWCVDWTMRSVS